MPQTLAKGSRITGDQRTALAQQYAERYAAGESIRSIAEDTGRSFGFVHGVLKESGVELRGRGGATRGSGASGATDTSGSAKRSRTKTARAPVKKATTADKVSNAAEGAKKAVKKVAGKASSAADSGGKKSGTKRSRTETAS